VVSGPLDRSKIDRETAGRLRCHGGVGSNRADRGFPGTGRPSLPRVIHHARAADSHRRRIGSVRVMKKLIVVVAAVAATAMVVVAQADVLPPRSIRALPATSGAPSRLVVSASFAQPAGAELQDYNVYFARGFTFDPRAAAQRCTPRQAKSASCPATSKIGEGTGQVSVHRAAPALAPFSIPITFYIMRPQRAGDIGGLVLAVRRGAIRFALLGRLVHVRHGIYGLELRFANTARELPSGVQVQLDHVRVSFGSQRTVRLRRGATMRHVTYHLLRNPALCPRRGWPFLLAVGYSTGNEHYTTRVACKAVN
jgi:hypothetical protein